MANANARVTCRNDEQRFIWYSACGIPDTELWVWFLCSPRFFVAAERDNRRATPNAAAKTKRRSTFSRGTREMTNGSRGPHKKRANWRMKICYYLKRAGKKTQRQKGKCGDKSKRKSTRVFGKYQSRTLSNLCLPSSVDIHRVHCVRVRIGRHRSCWQRFSQRQTFSSSPPTAHACARHTTKSVPKTGDAGERFSESFSPEM